MKLIHLIASLAIIACTTVAWFILGGALSMRTRDSESTLRHDVADVWGPPLIQQHPQAWFETPNAQGGRAQVLPTSSKVDVVLKSDPKQRGLLWHRTYDVELNADYQFTNTTRIPQTFYIQYPLPAGATGLHGFDCRLGSDSNTPAAASPSATAAGTITRACLIAAGESVTLHTAYRTRGSNSWQYQFPDPRRITGFTLTQHTNFDEISFPVGTGSPSARDRSSAGYTLVWNYPDVLAAPAIGMDMPKRLNAGPVAARIAFFAPVSLLFFMTVMLLVGAMRGIPLHPMHVFFVAAGFFAFHLLLAYLVDLIPLMMSFAVATTVSLILVSGYLRMVGGKRLFIVALPAQLIYLVIFSASFFMDGFTGITITILAVLTLALLMALTAKIDWRQFFTKQPPPLPTRNPQ